MNQRITWAFAHYILFWAFCTQFSSYHDYRNAKRGIDMSFQWCMGEVTKLQYYYR